MMSYSDGFDVPDWVYDMEYIPACFGKYDKTDEDCFFCNCNEDCEKEKNNG